MHWIDIAILLVLAVTLFLGVWRGFIHEVLAIIAWIAAFVGARLFAPVTADWLKEQMTNETVIMLLAWIIPFILVFIAVNLIRVALKTMIDMVGLKPVDRLFGGVFGLAKGGLWIVAITLVAQLAMSKPNQAFATDSRLLPLFQPLALWLIDNIDYSAAKPLLDMKDKGVAFDELASQAAMTLGLDREQLVRLQNRLELNSEQLLKKLQDPEQLEKLRRLLENPEFLKIKD